MLGPLLKQCVPNIFRIPANCFNSSRVISFDQVAAFSIWYAIRVSRRQGNRKHTSRCGARKGVGAIMGSAVPARAPSSPPNRTDYKSVIGMSDLPLCCGHLAWIYILTLEGGEPELTRDSSVGMWTREQYRNLQRLE